MKRSVPLEEAAQMVCDASSVPPLIFQLPPEEGRKRLDEAQDEPIHKYPAEISVMQVSTGRWGKINLYTVRPVGNIKAANVIFYIHGAGWVFGNFHTHEKLVRELADRTNCVVFFPEYSLSPEAKFPTAIEQCYSILSRIRLIAEHIGCQCRYDTLTVAGDSVGGNMATVMTLLAKYRRGLRIHKQLLFYPVTNANFQTPSYLKFATDYYLYRQGMMWFWDQYTSNLDQRSEITAAPLLASLEQLRGLPDALIINGEADVLRSEGEAYARNLREAGVKVTAARFQAIIHDFVMLNSLDATQACRGAMDLATEWINRKNKGFD